MICDSCGVEKDKVRVSSTNYNFIGSTCRTCYSNNLQRKKRNILTQDPFGCLPKERDYYDEHGWDLQRNQDLILKGLHA